jgi:hypothetical protein
MESLWATLGSWKTDPALIFGICFAKVRGLVFVEIANQGRGAATGGEFFSPGSAQPIQKARFG